MKASATTATRQANKLNPQQILVAVASKVRASFHMRRLHSSRNGIQLIASRPSTPMKYIVADKRSIVIPLSWFGTPVHHRDSRTNTEGSRADKAKNCPWKCRSLG